MPHSMTIKSNVFTLLQVTQNIQNVVNQVFKTGFWVKAEVNKLNFYAHSGHCFPELVEKTNGKVVAEMRSTIWNSDVSRINANFIKTLGEPLKDGITVLLFAMVDFHPTYGLTLKISDIDPSFTLGELEREKQESIQKLKSEGIFSLNKTKNLPLLPKRIAIISVESSKGYSDFMQVIQKNQWNYQFETFLFPAILQGDNAAPTIIAQLKRIQKVIQHFDVVAIIRGGGGDVGLSCYNNYGLAREIAMFPIPVFSGIGHSTNETVSEMVSYRNAITPTELADFLIQEFHNFWVPVQKAQEKIIQMSREVLQNSRKQLTNEVNFLKAHLKLQLQSYRNVLDLSKQNLKGLSLEFLSNQRTTINTVLQPNLIRSAKMSLKNSLILIEGQEKVVNLLNPLNLLKRGYSLTFVDGKILKSVENIQKGQRIQTQFVDGIVDSEVIVVEKK
jgi:exodeoxyribonuclease VII large subunit